MFAFDINIYNTDAHPIFDVTSGKLINYVKGITIGNHCWVGAKSTILKNSVLPDNCILGWGSVYSGCPKDGQEADYTNCAFAGNPAKMVKKGINWDSNGAKCGYIDNKTDEVNK